MRTCDVVIGELALGAGLPKTLARDLAALPKLPSPTALETVSSSNDIPAGMQEPELAGPTRKSC
ncbi:MAG TPA: hypothetical protein VFN67_12335 [Polyangiales bacterium]|nr:hypothetical protein [Polyangiales bacterium]